MDIAEVNDFLLFAFLEKQSKKLKIMRGPLFKIESSTMVQEMSFLYKAGDLCPVGLDVIGDNAPRIKWLNYCGAGQ
jgi:hypothetical protein